jgi:hypothetical protein
MSKRQRDHANIDSIRAILGDIPIQIIENLLHRSNHNVEAAVNLYFSGPLPSQPAPPLQISKGVKKNHGSYQQKNTGIKYFIGDLVITGMLTLSLWIT